MKNKITIISIILLLSVVSLGIAFGENYITPTTINQNTATFSNGMTGFCLNLTKDSINPDDNFTQITTTNDELENQVKLAIIESYKQKMESSLDNIVSSIVKGDLNSKNSVISAVLNTSEIVKNSETVNIDNQTEATFNFELLKSTDENKSDYLAYSVSFKEIEKEQKTTKSKVGAVNNNTTEKNDTDTNKTNNTVINKTTTVTVNETNTTVITTVKTTNTTHTPLNNDNKTSLLNKTGIPLLLLVIVIAVIVVIVVVKRRD